VWITNVTPIREDGAMGRNNRQRRSEKQHKQAERLRARRGPERAVAADTHLDVIGLLHHGARAAHGPLADEVVLDQVVDALVSASSTGRLDVGPALSARLVDLVGTLYENGWQPADLAHVIRRRSTSRVAGLLREAISDEATRAGAAARAPHEWLEQLAVVAAGSASVVAPRRPADARLGDALFSQWRVACGIGLAEALYDAFQLLGRLFQLPRLAPIGPFPSKWSTGMRTMQTTRHSAVDPKSMARIRALLAKAEATTFPAEAEAFTAKAQDLMTRHAIDATVLLAADDHDLRGDVVARRIHLDDPYAKEKVDLLATVCDANGVRTVWNEGLGFATVVGLPVDLDLAELLFTSLLLQATRAVGEAAAVSARSRSRSFRRAFLVAYAHRIGERLAEAVTHANTDAAQQYGTALVPILAARDEAVDDEYIRMFPSTRPMRSSRRFDAHGWAAGCAAADLAVLDAGRSRLGG
jgi:hypothetical protein